MVRVLSFSCLHTPFDLDGYADFLNDTRKMYKTDHAVCLGDEMDFHRISFHDKEPSAMGAIEELALAKKRLKKYMQIFPKLDVCISNHASRPFRLAAQVGIPKDFIREYADFMGAPKGWSWRDEYEIDGVLYFHGEGFPHAKRAMEKKMQSVVMGHLHTQAGVSYYATKLQLIFGLSVGCGVDQKSYAFNYAKHIPAKSVIGCGVVADGRHAMFVPMYKPNKIKRIGR
jgi:hypothetical protein